MLFVHLRGFSVNFSCIYFVFLYGVLAHTFVAADIHQQLRNLTTYSMPENFCKHSKSLQVSNLHTVTLYISRTDVPNSINLSLQAPKHLTERDPLVYLIIPLFSHSMEPLDGRTALVQCSSLMTWNRSWRMGIVIGVRSICAVGVDDRSWKMNTHKNATLLVVLAFWPYDLHVSLPIESLPRRQYTLSLSPKLTFFYAPHGSD